MSYVSNREIASMSTEAREARLLELQEELLQLRAEHPLEHGRLQGHPPKHCATEDAHERRPVKTKEVMENNGGYLQRLRTTR